MDGQCAVMVNTPQGTIIRCTNRSFVQIPSPAASGYYHQGTGNSTVSEPPITGVTTGPYEHRLHSSSGPTTGGTRASQDPLGDLISGLRSYIASQDPIGEIFSQLDTLINERHDRSLYCRNLQTALDGFVQAYRATLPGENAHDKYMRVEGSAQEARSYLMNGVSYGHLNEAQERMGLQGIKQVMDTMLAAVASEHNSQSFSQVFTSDSATQNQPSVTSSLTGNASPTHQEPDTRGSQAYLQTSSRTLSGPNSDDVDEYVMKATAKATSLLDQTGNKQDALSSLMSSLDKNPHTKSKAQEVAVATPRLLEKSTEDVRLFIQYFIKSV